MLYYLPQDQLNTEHHEHIKKGVKTEEEIKKYLLPQTLDEPKKILYLLLKGQNIQRRSAIDSLSSTLKAYPYIISNTISIIKQIISTLDNELQILLIQQIIKITPRSNEKIMVEFSELALKHLEQFKNQNVTIKWMELIKQIILHPSFSEVQDEYLSTATKLSGTKQILPSKLVSVRLIGYLSFKVKTKLKGVLLDRIRSFLRSQQEQLKLTILKQVMPLLFLNLSIQLINIYYLQKIFQMIYDTQQEIKLCSIHLLITYIDSLSIDDKQRLSKIIIEHLEQSEYHAYFSDKIGQIYLKIHFQFQKRSYIGSFISSFKQLLLSDNPSIRYNALFNAPCLLINMNFKLWTQIKNQYFDIVIEDQDSKVREIAIVIFHEIVKIIGIQKFQEFNEIILQIIQSIDLFQKSHIYSFLQGYPTLLKTLKQQLFQLKCKELDTLNISKVFMSQFQIISQLQTWIICVITHHQSQNNRVNNDVLEECWKVLGQCACHYSVQFIEEQCLAAIYEEFKQVQMKMDQSVLDCLCLVVYELIGKIQINHIWNYLKQMLLQGNFRRKIVFLKVARKLLFYLSGDRYKDMKIFQLCTGMMDTKIVDIKLQLVVYLQEAGKYIVDAKEVLNKLFLEEEIKSIFDKPGGRVLSEVEIEQIKLRNSECLRNEEQIKFHLEKKQDQKRQDDKKGTGLKPSILNNKKPNRFNLFGKPTNPSLLTINTLLAKQYRINKTLDNIKDTKSHKKMMINKMIEAHQKPSNTTQKRKIQSFEIAHNEKKPVNQLGKRRKTVNQNKSPINI